MDATEMREAVDRGIRNQIAQLHHLALTSPGGTIEDTPDYLFFAGAHDLPGTMTNGAIRKTQSIGAAELLARASVFFGTLNRQYFLWVEDQADADLEVVARRRGFWHRPPETGIPGIIRTVPFDSADDPPGFEIFESSEESDLQTYMQIISRHYELEGLDDALIESVLFSMESLRSDAVRIFLARDTSTGLIEAASSTFCTPDCVGLEWLVTNPAARGRGVGSALMRRMTNYGFARGARTTWGIASQEGLPAWTRLGFEVGTHYQRYLVPAS
jgi:GNAT superfamily N-acetyltransferase